MSKKYTTEQFIAESKKIHGDKYNYSKSIYTGYENKLKIICPIHGEFEQTPHGHLHGKGCNKCGHERTNLAKRLTTEQFINKAKQIHGNTYDYSLTTYIDCLHDVIIICPIHGEFKQNPHNHLNGNGCYMCGKEKSDNAKRSNKNDFIEKARKLYGNKYDYSKVEYINNRTNVTIICPIHGEFQQTPDNHLHGHECDKCVNERFSIERRDTKEHFIEKARKVHGDKYDYSKVDYINIKTTITIICPIHGEFTQTPHHHVYGNGCPKCKSSKLENEIRQFLTDNNIEFIEQYRCDWLGLQSLDFYLPKHNIAIECQGHQHFFPVDFGSKGVNYANERLEYTKQLDENKRNLCLEHGINIIYYSNLGIDYPYDVIENKEELLTEIYKCQN